MTWSQHDNCLVAVVEFQRDEDVVTEVHEAESMRSTNGVDGRDGGHGAGPSAMDIDGRGGQAAAPAGGFFGSRQALGSSRQGGGAAATASATRDFSRQSSSRIHHVHFHESGCPPLAAPSTRTGDQALMRTADQSLPRGMATDPPGGGSPVSGDAGHIGPFGDSGSQHPVSSSEQRVDGPDPGSQRVPSVEQLALLQRVDSHQTIKHSARAASAGALPEELSATEQGSVVGVKRSNSGVVSPNKDGEKLPLKCAITWPFCTTNAQTCGRSKNSTGIHLLVDELRIWPTCWTKTCVCVPNRVATVLSLLASPLRRKLFEEGLPATLAAALTATAKAPVHALTNGVHAAVASVASAAALPFVSSGAVASMSLLYLTHPAPI